MVESVLFVEMLKGSVTLDKVGAVLYPVLPFVYFFFLFAFSLKQVVRSGPASAHNKTTLM